MIYLYESTTKDFRYNGQPLPKAYDVIVDHLINDEFFVVGKYPLDKDGRYKTIQKDTIVKVHTPEGMQPFRILDPYKYDGYVEFEAWPLFYADMRSKLVRPFSVSGMSGQQILNTFVSRLLIDTPFTFTSNITNNHDFTVQDAEEAEREPNQLFDALEVFKRIVKRWNGELVIDGYDIRLVNRVGQDTDALLYEKKNITNFVDKESLQSIVTRLHGKSQWTEDGPDGEQIERSITTTVDSPLINAYSGVIFERQYTNNDIRTEEELKNWLNLMFTTDNIDKPSRNIESETNIVDGTKISMGDGLNLKYIPHDVDMMIRMNRYEYDGFNNRYLKVYLGDPEEHFTGNVQNQMSDLENNVRESNEAIAHTILNAAGNKIIYSTEKPNGNFKDGDTFFDTDDRLLFRWDEQIGDWVEVKSDADRQVQEILEQMVTDRQKAQENYQAALDHTDQKVAEQSQAFDKEMNALNESMSQEITTGIEGAVEQAGRLAQQEAQTLSDALTPQIQGAQETADTAVQTANSAYTDAVAEAGRVVQQESVLWEQEYNERVGILTSSINDIGDRAEKAITDAGGNADLINAHDTILSRIETQTLPQMTSIIEESQDLIVNIRDNPGSHIDGYQSITETADLYERVIGSNDEEIANSVTRMVMTDELFQTEVSNRISEADQERMADKTSVLSGRQIYTDQADNSVVHVEMDGQSVGGGSGKNLLQEQYQTQEGVRAYDGFGGSDYTKIETGYRISGRWSAFGFRMVLEQNTKYTVHGVLTMTNTSNQNERLRIGVNANSGNGWAEETTEISSNGFFSFTFTSRGDNFRDVIAFATSANGTTSTRFDITELMMEKGESVSEYELSAPTLEYPVEIHSLNDFDLISSTELLTKEAVEKFDYNTNDSTIDKINFLLPRPLRSAGDVKDRIYRGSDGVWKRETNVGEFNLADSYLGWWSENTNPNEDGTTSYVFGAHSRIGLNEYSTHMTGSHFKYIRRNDYSLSHGDMSRNSSAGYLGHNVHFGVSKNEFPTKESFYDWIIEEDNNGTPVIIQYKLQNPTTENLPPETQEKLNNLKSFKDSNYVYTVIPDKSGVLSSKLKPTLHATFKNDDWYEYFLLDKTSTRVTQLADSWAVQMLNEAEDIVSQINLSPNTALIEAENIIMDGYLLGSQAYFDDLAARSLTAVEGDITRLITNHLEAEAITAHHIKVDSALVGDIIAERAFFDALQTETAWITNAMVDELSGNKITSGKVDTAYLDAIDIVTQGLTADVVTSEHLLVNNALIDELMTGTLLTDALLADTGFINDLNANSITAVQGDITRIITDHLGANTITSRHLRVDEALIDSLFAHSAMFGNLQAEDAWIRDAMIANISADKITTGEINSAVANTVFLNANSGSFETAYFIQTVWNNISTQITIDDRGIMITGNDRWRRTHHNQTGLELYNGSGANNRAGAIGYFKTTYAESAWNENVMLTGGRRLRHSIGMAADPEHVLVLGYTPNNTTDRTYLPAMEIDPQRNGHVTFLTETTFEREVNLTNPRITDGLGQTGGFLTRPTSLGLSAVSEAKVSLGIGTPSSWYDKIVVESNAINIHEDTYVNGLLRMMNNRIDEIGRLNLADGAGYMSKQSNGGINIGSTTGGIDLVRNGSVKFRIGSWGHQSYAHLEMQGYDIISVGQIRDTSDRRLKTQIEDYRKDILKDFFGVINPVTYRWTDPEMSQEQQFGLIAQDTPIIGDYMEEIDRWTIDSKGQIMVNTFGIKAIYEIYLEEQKRFYDLEKVQSEHTSDIDKLKTGYKDLEKENERLKQELNQLKEKVA